MRVNVSVLWIPTSLEKEDVVAPSSNQIVSVKAQTFPYDRTYDLYQEYYRTALQAFCQEIGATYLEQSTAYSAWFVRKLRALRHSYKLRMLMKQPWAAFLVDGMASLLSRGRSVSAPRVGIYDVTTRSGDCLTVYIDSSDSHELKERTEADIYYKSNYWPARTYPSYVRSIANLNPLVGRELPYFRSLRSVPKTVDLFAFFRLWGGKDELEGLEHNLSLIEGLAKAPCSKYLCAYLVAGDIAQLSKRLESQGIHWTSKPMTKHELWRRAAGARLNIVRLGMHECLPWRMVDILAMGGCPVIDYGPQTVWPEPLVEDRHYLNLHIPPTAPGKDLIGDKIAGWLREPELIHDICRNTADYFDQHLTPEMLGRTLLQRVNAETRN